MEFEKECCLCGQEMPPWHEGTEGRGNNPEPLASWPQRCCDNCNKNLVIPARLARVARGETW